MLLLSCSGLVRGFDAGPLFRDIGFELRAGERVGLVGPNGVGKTTLLRILAGLDQPDEGDVRLHAGARVALLEQETEEETRRQGDKETLFGDAKSALDELVAAHDEMIRIAEELARRAGEDENGRQGEEETRRRGDKETSPTPPLPVSSSPPLPLSLSQLTARYERLNEMLRHHDAYNVDHRVEHVLDGLGFTAADYDWPVATFSGGQQRRLMLAKMLLAAPDVMLLDEPSNHLDIATTEWLETYLCKQPEAMLIVSHDRFFLNRVVTKIFELNAERISAYIGNYQAYVQQRQERYERQLREYEAQREYIAKREEYIRRVHYGQLHKQAQSRQKQLDKLERIERPSIIDMPHMHFGEVRRSGDVVLRVEDLKKAYDRPLFDKLNFTLERGRRLGIMGPNGSGKTTLLRVLLGDEAADAGTVQRGHLVSFGYYDQQLQTLPADMAVIDAVNTIADLGSRIADSDRNPQSAIRNPQVNPEGRSLNLELQPRRNLLARFGLVGDQINQRVGDLSGGERSRVALARLVAQEVNVLVLDEPTNHLDLWACEALESALLEFEGTIIVVSHDRYFLNRVVNLLLVLDGNGGVSVVHGNYETYERMRSLAEDKENGRQGERETRRKRAGESDSVSSSPPTRLKRKRRFPHRKVEDLEAEIAATEERQRELEQLLASTDLYRDGDKVKDTLREFEEIKPRLQQLYEHWEEAVELN